jgi:cation diffusion facilitator CzcD-associated flavoprotein CzcO
MSAPDYPITLDVTGRRVLVVGAGPVAERRVRRLLTAGALVDVIAPRATEGITELSASGEIDWFDREFDIADLVTPKRAWLVHTATGISGVMTGSGMPLRQKRSGASALQTPRSPQRGCRPSESAGETPTASRLR